mgnify:CR=1 FL=1
MNNENIFYCYSYRLFHFLLAFNQKCMASRVNSNSQKRYWTFEKNEDLDKIVNFYNEVKHNFS